MKIGLSFVYSVVGLVVKTKLFGHLKLEFGLHLECFLCFHLVYCHRTDTIFIFPLLFTFGTAGLLSFINSCYLLIQLMIKILNRSLEYSQYD